MNLARTLIHIAQLKRQSAANDGWGQPAYSSAATVSCYLAGSDKRVLSANGQEVQADYEMFISPTSSIAVNDAVETVTEPGGQTLLAAGRVIQVQVCSHLKLGLVATQAFIVRN